MDQLHEFGTMSNTAFFWISTIKMLVAFLVVLLTVAFTTLAERRFAAFIQDRLGPNRVGPYGLLQPIADGLKNFIKEETLPGEASRVYFILGPILAMGPAFVLFAVIPWAAPLPTPWGIVDMIVADVPMGILFILAFSSLGVYGTFLAGWSSNNKYSFLGGLRASAQMVSYEVALGMSLIPIFLIVGNVTITDMVWYQQEGLGWWFAFPLGLAFFLFVISSFAETARLPFDMPEAESELVAGYHAEYSSMKFSMFMMGEYAHVITQAALMATLFLGGWDIPFWQGDDMRVLAGGVVMGAEPAWWKSVLTFAYIMLVATTILVLDTVGMEYGFMYGLILTVVNLVATVIFLWVLDSDRLLRGSSTRLSSDRQEAEATMADMMEQDAVEAPAEPAGV